MKTAISLPDPLFKAADRLAARLGISRSQLFQRALKLMLEKQEATTITAALDEVYGRPGVKGTVDLVLSRLQDTALPREDW